MTAEPTNTRLIPLDILATCSVLFSVIAWELHCAPYHNLL